MFGNLSGWTGFILLVVVLVLIAGPKLPQFAKSIGESANIFKNEVNKIHTQQQQGAADFGKNGQTVHSVQAEQGLDTQTNANEQNKL